MTYYQTFSPKPCPNLIHVQRFLRDHGSVLAKAVYQLGGPGASARVFLLSEAVRHTQRLTPAQSSHLVAFHRLLKLEHVSDPDRIESSLFALINPESTFVNECCLLAEKLDALLQKIAENEPIRNIHCEAPQKVGQVA
ncbi:hypothetical protein EDD52_101290 [Primorskyibacter sedentarius]|uniref:Uncharacterized protein n=1 Tax=Primorskyibacter sedentarius TaxID=745311 RepID=A0A4R3JPB8_9RHOB|nr:hypothetical protein [Primorskyibacter sedentarius]TCS67195.1 hypothetical protein EDD52_101290 [Primorskyibacter sedentarius]